MKNKVRRLLSVVVVSLLIMIVVGTVYRYATKPKCIANQSMNKEIVKLSPEKTVYLENLHLDNFTCTGMTYDKYDNAFWIADYGALQNSDKPNPRLIEVSYDFTTVLNVLSISNLINETANVQGITYDDSNDSLWVATGNYIYNFSKEGNVLAKIDMKKYAKYSSNGLSYDNNDDTLWTLCYSKFLLNYNKSGKIINKIEINYQDQDHIYLEDNRLYITVGADYSGNDNYVMEVDLDSTEAKLIYRIDESYAIEGICIIGNKMYIVNDGFYHSAKINKSYINIYEIP